MGRKKNNRHIRTCHRCKKVYITKAKYSEYCDKCKKPTLYGGKIQNQIGIPGNNIMAL